MGDYTKIVYTNGSGEPLSADNLNHGEEGIRIGNLRVGGYWKGTVYFTANVETTSTATFNNSGNYRSYFDGGTDAMFTNGSYYDGIVIPAGYNAIGVMADVKFNSASDGGYIEIIHLRNSTETKIAEDAEDNTSYGLSTGVYYPVSQGDKILVKVTATTSVNSSGEVSLSFFAL